jgi:hypothetical protein
MIPRSSGMNHQWRLLEVERMAAEWKSHPQIQDGRIQGVLSHNICGH